MELMKNKKTSPLICSVEYAFPADIESMENVELNQVRIVMKSNKEFQKLYGTPSSHNFSQPTENSSAGLLYKQKLSLYNPGVEITSEKTIEQLERIKAIFKITFQNNLIQILGSKENPAKLIGSFSSAEATGNVVTITCESDERAKFLIN